MIAMLMAMAMTISIMGVFRDSGVSQESLPFHLTLRGEHLQWLLFWGLLRSKIFQPEIYNFTFQNKFLRALMMKRRQGVSQGPPSPSIFSHVLARPDHSWEFNPHHHFYWESGFGFHSIKAIIIRFHQRSWPTSIMDTINVLKLGNSKPSCSRVCLAANSFWQWLKSFLAPIPIKPFSKHYSNLRICLHLRKCKPVPKMVHWTESQDCSPSFQGSAPKSHKLLAHLVFLNTIKLSLQFKSCRFFIKSPYFLSTYALMILWPHV